MSSFIVFGLFILTSKCSSELPITSDEMEQFQAFKTEENELQYIAIHGVLRRAFSLKYLESQKTLAHH